MKLAFRETPLQGDALPNQLAWACAQGAHGIEFAYDAGAFDARIFAVFYVIQHMPLEVSAIHLSYGAHNGLLSEDTDTRETALHHLRGALAAATDLATVGAVFVPQYHTAPLDEAQAKLEHELLVWLLRTNSDLAYALGTQLLIHAMPQPHTFRRNTLASVAAYRRIINNHPQVWLAGHDIDSADLHAHLAETRVIYTDTLAQAHALLAQPAIAAAEGWVTVTQSASA
jgi:hypothetical protein